MSKYIIGMFEPTARSAWECTSADEHKRWCTRLKKRYELIEKTCLDAILEIRNDQIVAFAAFAYDIGWWESDPKGDACYQSCVTAKEYRTWQHAYYQLPLQIRKQAEAALPFVGRASDAEYLTWEVANSAPEKNSSLPQAKEKP